MKKLGIIVSFLLILLSNTGYAKDNTEKVGDVLQVPIPATAYATTYALDDKEGRRQFYKSLLTNTVITYALKYSVNKSRPENNGKYAFPSGHTSAAFQGGLPSFINAMA